MSEPSVKQAKNPAPHDPPGLKMENAKKVPPTTTTPPLYTGGETLGICMSLGKLLSLSPTEGGGN